MAERNRHDFPDEIRYLVKDQQKRICADCGTRCDGQHPRKLQIHHVVPQALGGSIERANAIGLCANCHRRHDQEALCNGKTFYETLLEEGKWFQVSRLAKLAGIPAPLLESPKALRRHLSREDAPQILKAQRRDTSALENVVFYDEAPQDQWGDVEKTGRTYRAR